jgi:hypothetical protein
MSMASGPRFECSHKLAADAFITISLLDDHSEHPWRTIATFFDIESSQADSADSLTTRIDRHPGDGKFLAACLPGSDVHPPIEPFRLGRTTPLPPADLTDHWNQMRVIRQ